MYFFIFHYRIGFLVLGTYHAFNVLLVHGDWTTRKAAKTLLGRVFDGGNFDAREFQVHLSADLNDMVEQVFCY